MDWISKLFRRLGNKLYGKNQVIAPEAAYDLLAAGYDDRKSNVLNELDQTVLSEFRRQLPSSVSSVLDFGAGTGRNIAFLNKLNPQSIYAIDLSEEMLRRLSQKFPEVQTIKYVPNESFLIETASIDLITCNLTLGYITELDFVLSEWNRVLKVGAQILLTDLHPEINQKGKSRTFAFENKNLVIESKGFSFEDLRKRFERLNWNVLAFRELELSDSSEALKTRSEKSKDAAEGKKLLFGFLLEKNDG